MRGWLILLLIRFGQAVQRALERRRASAPDRRRRRIDRRAEWWAQWTQRFLP